MCMGRISSSSQPSKGRKLTLTRVDGGYSSDVCSLDMWLSSLSKLTN